MDGEVKKGSFDPVVSDALVIQEQDAVYLDRWREFRIQQLKVLKESEIKLKERYEAFIEQELETTDKTVARSEDSEWRLMVSRLVQGKRPFRE